jgi:hypothetical protein
LHAPLQQSDAATQNAAVGWQQVDWHVPATQLELQQSASTEQDCPESAQDVRQAPATFAWRGPEVAAPAVPSPDPSSPVTRNQKYEPGAGISETVPEVVVVA